MELTGKITGIAADPNTDKIKITFTINEGTAAILCCNEMKGKLLDINVEIFRKKRSNSANRYFWVLCGKLAAKTQQKKSDIYKQLIREIGDNFDIFAVKNDAVSAFIEKWQAGRVGWTCEILGDSDEQGYTDICAYYGSSTYNSKQMSDLINGVIMECREQGIQTETPEEIARMLEAYKNV